jgi:hypothetical protein
MIFSTDSLLFTCGETETIQFAGVANDWLSGACVSMAILLLNDVQTLCGTGLSYASIDGENRLKARTFSFLERILLLVYRLAFILAKRIN